MPVAFQIRSAESAYQKVENIGDIDVTLRRNNFNPNLSWASAGNMRLLHLHHHPLEMFCKPYSSCAVSYQSETEQAMIYVNNAFKATLLTAVRCREIVARSAPEPATTFFPENTAPMEPDFLLLYRFGMPVEISSRDDGNCTSKVA